MPGGPPPIARRRYDSLGLSTPLILERWWLGARWRHDEFTTNPGIADYVTSRTLLVGGTAPSRPRFTITYPAGADHGITSISIVNATVDPDRPFTIRRVYAPGDILVVDSETYDVTIEDTTRRPVVPSGPYPLLDPRFGLTNVIEFHVLATSQPSIIPEVRWTPRFIT